MSSNTYSAQIAVDERLRNVVLLVGLALALLGAFMIAWWPTSVAGRVLGLIGWLFWSGRELLTYWRVYARWSGLRVAADGTVEVQGSGRHCAARVLPGSLVLAELAWLRIRADNGDQWGELIAGNHRESEEWRRFQVIFRHLNAC